MVVQPMGSNFSIFEDLANTSTSNVVNAMVIKAANVGEQLAMMMQNVKTLKKSIEEKDW